MDNLPLHRGTHKEALAEAQKRAKYLVTVLHSPEHQNSETFMNSMLVHADIISALKHDFIVWIGDVSQKEGYALSWDLGATTFPFVGVFFKKTPYLRLMGTFTRGDFLHNLGVCRKNTEGLQAEEITWVRDREERDMMREMQERELEEAKVKDMAKKKEQEEKKRREEEEARLAAEAEEAAREEERRQREEAEELERQKEEEKALALSALPSEEEMISGVPANQIASIVLVSLDGTSHERKWPYDASVDLLYKFAVSQEEYDGKNFYLAGGFPPKRVPKDDGSKIGDHKILVPRCRITMREELA